MLNRFCSHRVFPVIPVASIANFTDRGFLGDYGWMPQSGSKMRVRARCE